jgi:hypothetical protein
MTESARDSQQLNLPHRVHSATHQFSNGQAVRLKNLSARSGEVYFIIACLPPNFGSPQYRIRNADEMFERMAMEVDLELMWPSISEKAETSAEERAAGREASVAAIFAGWRGRAKTGRPTTTAVFTAQTSKKRRR